MILRDDNVEGAIEFGQAAVRRLMSGEASMCELAVTKALWRVDMGDIQEMVANEKDSVRGLKRPLPLRGRNVVIVCNQLCWVLFCDSSQSTVAHVALAERLLRRDPTRVFMLGERLPHVFLLGESGARQSELAEDPVYALKNVRDQVFFLRSCGVFVLQLLDA